MTKCLLLLSLFCSFSYSFSYENDLPNVTIQHVCENDLLFIKCLNINETIQIVRSMYGRTSQRICNHDLTYRFYEKTCANIEQSKYQTKLRCQGKSTCQMLIDNQIFTDPCGLDIPKHFEVHYRCINQEEICPKLFFNCSKSKDLKCIKRIQEEFLCPCPSTICQYNGNQLIGFVENVCPEEYLQGFSWPKTLIHQNQSLPCPSPCNGEIKRFCQLNNQWSKVNYTNCECPIKQSDQLSTHRSANSYVFQCNFWLINRLLPEDNSCILSFTNWNEITDNGSLNCLLSAFEQMTFQSCLLSNSFGIDFQNLAFEVYVPKNNENHWRLLSNTDDLVLHNELIVDRTEMINENSPMIVIDTKNQSMILIEHGHDFNLVQTANVTVIFTRPSFDFHYQCRAYRSTNFSLHVNSTNMFFACQLLCSNTSHVICQCPFFNPFMHYLLHIDLSRTHDECFEDMNKSIEENLNEIDRYVEDVSSFTSAKRVLLLIEKIMDKDHFYINQNILYQMIKQINNLAIRLTNFTNSFTSINQHIELLIKSKHQSQFENTDQSVSISVKSQNLDYQFILFTLSNINTTEALNSQIVSLNILPENFGIDTIQINFRHLNKSNQIPTCVYLKNNENDVQWSTDGCELLSTNLTHSLCSCSHLSTFALLMDVPKPLMNWDKKNFLSISKVGCIVSIICISVTIILLIIMRSHMNMDDDLTLVRNILHTNMLLCLFIVQILFLFGIDQTKYKFGCRVISILIDYFLLATISWMFVDGIELSIALKHMFKIDRIRLTAYSLYSYGFPLLIVFLSITLSSKTGNDTPQYCWLSHDNAFIWTFAIPFILLIIANLCFFTTSIYSICKNFAPSDHMNKIRFSLRDISLISILFGLTWIIALFYLYGQTILFAYLFAILNSFHGLLILIFYCLFQTHIRDSFGKVCFCEKHHTSFFRCFIQSNRKHTHKKSLEHFSLPDNTSSSGYSSAHSSDLHNKQILSNQPIGSMMNYTNHHHHHYNRRSGLTNETSYLPSLPINLLPNRLSTFRYQLPSNELILSPEQKEQLLDKTPAHDDDHQYYEIG